MLLHHLQIDAVVQQCGRGEVFPYSLPSVGPGADPSVQAVSPQVLYKSFAGGRLPILSARAAVTFPAEKLTVLRPVPSYSVW